MVDLCNYIEGGDEMPEAMMGAMTEGGRTSTGLDEAILRHVDEIRPLSRTLVREWGFLRTGGLAGGAVSYTQSHALIELERGSADNV
ncbi:MAG: hypothetical protein KC609_23140, partial [Myxococcales bacterium]|nr:hypothetical protein [Myxococcales bacterium]